MAFKHMREGQRASCVPGVRAVTLKKEFVQSWQQVSFCWLGALAWLQGFLYHTALYPLECTQQWHHTNQPKQPTNRTRPMGSWRLATSRAPTSFQSSTGSGVATCCRCSAP